MATATIAYGNGQVIQAFNPVASSATPSVNTSLSDKHLLTVDQNMTISFTDVMADGQMIHLLLVSDAFARVITWGVGITAASLVTTALKKQTITFVYEIGSTSWIEIARSSAV